jgi:hypothetical protein
MTSTYVHHAAWRPADLNAARAPLGHLPTAAAIGPAPMWASNLHADGVAAWLISCTRIWVPHPGPNPAREDSRSCLLPRP